MTKATATLSVPIALENYLEAHGVLSSAQKKANEATAALEDAVTAHVDDYPSAESDPIRMFYNGWLITLVPSGCRPSVTVEPIHSAKA